MEMHLFISLINNVYNELVSLYSTNMKNANLFITYFHGFIEELKFSVLFVSFGMIIT